jgi:hypothetical protein
MAQRVVFALRELADALEELQVESPWLFVDERGRGTDTAAGPAPSVAASSPGPSSAASSVAYHQDERLYLVLAWPSDDTKTGLYIGKWKDLEARLPGRHLAGSAVKLRRVESRAQAEEIWLKERPGKLLREVRM